jgi:hypothetical protein
LDTRFEIGYHPNIYPTRVRVSGNDTNDGNKINEVRLASRRKISIES